METNSQRTPVLIVGAGPTGLILALWLQKRGIDFRIIDKTAEPGTTSRALAVQARTLEFYRQLGIAEALIKSGILVQELVMRRSGRVIAKAELGDLGRDVSAFPYLLFCSQDIHENFLCEVLEKLGKKVERNTELVKFDHDVNGSMVTLKTPQGEEILHADYLCGCDGAKSSVRKGLTSQFPGGSYSQIFFVADVIVAEETNQDILEQGVQISVSKKDFCIIMPIKIKDTVRLTGIVPPESENLNREITYADVADSILRNTGIKVKSVNWFSTYHVHHRVAKDFRQGRVFLLGDAGHIHSPAGGQGMNTGIGDAVNLAWKLADVIQQRVHEKILDTYETEREAFAKVLVKTTDTAFRFIASRGFWGGFFRAYILPFLFAFLTKFKFVRSFMFRTISQTKINYRESFLSDGKAGKIEAGDRLPWVRNFRGDNFDHFKSMDWQLHIYGFAEVHFKSSVKKIKIALHEFEWNQEAQRHGLKHNSVYLIRPDGYIALILETQNIEPLKKYLSEKLGFNESLAPAPVPMRTPISVTRPGSINL